MAIVEMPLSSLVAYENNPRRNDHVISKMVASISEFGFTIPILAKSDGEVIDGHLRLKAAQSLQMESVPVILCDRWTDAQVKAFRLLVNRSVNWAEWDPGLLKMELADLQAMDFDLALTGFESLEIENLFKDDVAVSDPEPRSEAAAQLQREWKTEVGQLWKIGVHRFMIGSSASDGDIALLRSGAQPDGICTDPPYELDVNECSEILRRFADVAIVLASDAQIIGLAQSWAFRIGFIWKRRQPRSWPTEHQPVFYHTPIAVMTRTEHVPSQWKRPTPDFGSIIEVEREFEHSAMGHAKSAELFSKMLAGFDWKIVAEPFSGTGATLLACESSQRQCLAMELDPSTAAVALQRWKDAGLKPELAETHG